MLIVRKMGNHFRAVVLVVYSPNGKENVLSIDLLVVLGNSCILLREEHLSFLVRLW